MPYELFHAYEEILVKNDTIDENDLSIYHDTTRAKLLKPGFTRLNISFFFDEDRVDFILNAIQFVCEHGWKFLPLYTVDLVSGAYKPRNFHVLKERQKLSNITYRNNSFNLFKPESAVPESPENSPNTYAVKYTFLFRNKKNYFSMLIRKKTKFCFHFKFNKGNTRSCSQGVGKNTGK